MMEIEDLTMEQEGHRDLSFYYEVFWLRSLGVHPYFISKELAWLNDECDYIPEVET